MVWFDSAEDLNKAYESPEGIAALADAPLCIQIDGLITLPITEEIIPSNTKA